MSNEKLLINDHKSNNSEVMRNKQIEEMARDIPQRIVAYDRDPNGQYLYTEQRLEIAETLVNADYLKQSEVVKEVLEKTPPELASDIMNRGIVMTGGGSLLHGMDILVSERTGLPTYIPDDAISCVAIGTGLALQNIDVLRGSEKKEIL